jgi:hypothetical protein
MKHKEYEKDVSSECTQKQKVVEDVNSARLVPLKHDISYVLQPQEEHKTKKIKRCGNYLSQFRITSD